MVFLWQCVCGGDFVVVFCGSVFVVLFLRCFCGGVIVHVGDVVVFFW